MIEGGFRGTAPHTTEEPIEMIHVHNHRPDAAEPDAAASERSVVTGDRTFA
jgi:hypothetical protein